MKHQISSKRLLRLFIKYSLAATAVVLTYFAVMFILFSLAGTSYRSVAHVLLFAVLFLVLGLFLEPFERLMIHSFTFSRQTNPYSFSLLASYSCCFVDDCSYNRRNDQRHLAVHHRRNDHRSRFSYFRQMQFGPSQLKKERIPNGCVLFIHSGARLQAEA